MRKKISFIVIIIVIIFIFDVNKLSAATSTPTASPSSEAKKLTPTISAIDKLKKIEILKEKIATKVAEIREKEKRGVGGKIKSLTNSSIVLSIKAEKEINISYSEDTVFYMATDSGKTEVSNNKLKEGESVTVFGYYDLTKDLLSAKYIYFNQKKERLIGKIANIDKTNYTVTIKLPQEEILADIETYSKLYTLNKDKLVKSGFSKLKIGDFVILHATPNPKEENKYSVLRLFHFSFLSITPTPTNPSEKESSPSSLPQ
jgi:hypothetical protein